ncbi:DUF4376 domain-containing protein [Oxalobacter aliiformigenes]|uniref:DUF4376 domain-containing protein n=1 Tax=Oxalobacter aliiformigenes TaxID=2946593 RepID=A0A9E9LBR1_9BURK|nr:DUF4376 domain-containing protein [Oxalobacter aliiformigenes]WAV88343.1 DUF4376 domain-containing protein [Oxalobacter aliiformigenes]WAV90383.1 DUF4376 domain-containing protein [Oxalobacter aliiformigenes]
MNIIEAKNPKYIAADKKIIQLEVKFEEIQDMGFLPFGATEDDVEAHGRELYRRALSGEFGEIEEFVRDLETERANKLSELSTAFEDASEMAHLTSSLGFEIDANETANRDIEGLTLVMSDTDTTLFCDYNNQFHEVTRAQLETMRREIVANSQRLYQIKWQYRSLIEAATTVDELDAITIRFDKTEGETDEHVQTV